MRYAAVWPDELVTWRLCRRGITLYGLPGRLVFWQASPITSLNYALRCEEHCSASVNGGLLCDSVGLMNHHGVATGQLVTLAIGFNNMDLLHTGCAEKVPGEQQELAMPRHQGCPYQLARTVNAPVVDSGVIVVA